MLFKFYTVSLQRKGVKYYLVLNSYGEHKTFSRFPKPFHAMPVTPKQNTQKRVEFLHNKFVRNAKRAKWFKPGDIIQIERVSGELASKINWREAVIKSTRSAHNYWVLEYREL